MGCSIDSLCQHTAELFGTDRHDHIFLFEFVQEFIPPLFPSAMPAAGNAEKTNTHQDRLFHIAGCEELRLMIAW